MHDTNNIKFADRRILNLLQAQNVDTQRQCNIQWRIVCAYCNEHLADIHTMWRSRDPKDMKMLQAHFEDMTKLIYYVLPLRICSSSRSLFAVHSSSVGLRILATEGRRLWNTTCLSWRLRSCKSDWMPWEAVKSARVQWWQFSTSTSTSAAPAFDTASRTKSTAGKSSPPFGVTSTYSGPPDGHCNNRDP